MPQPVTVLCTYRVVPGREADFEALLARHYPALRGADLATERPPSIYRGTDGTGGPVYYELFEWKDAESPSVAHESPAVMAVWEPMGELCEGREGRPQFEFPHVEPVEIAYPDLA